MAFPTFTPPVAPSAGPTSLDEQPRSLVAQYGDGYRQTLPDGLNPLTMRVRLAWSALTDAQATAILSFLRTNKSAVFYYTLPGEGVPRRWEALAWSRDFSNGVIGTVTAELEERFDPDS